MNLGVRFDHYSTFGHTTNPRAGLIWTPGEETALKLLYGTAFRAPNAYELFYHDGEETVKANPDLEAETLDTWELVYERQLEKNLRGLVTVYRYAIEDLIDLDTDPADDLLYFRNLNEVEATGVELEVAARWSSGVTGRLSYAYQDAENSLTGRQLSNSPDHLAKLHLIVPLRPHRVFAGIETLYTSGRDARSGDAVSSHLVANLTVFSKILKDSMEISGSIYNLFDETYSDPASEEHLQTSIEQDGRKWRVGLRYRF